MADNTLKEKTSKGLFWGAINHGTTQVLNLLIGIFLARRLSKGDYGILAVITIFTLVAGSIQSAGFSQALANMKKPTHNDYNAVFWFNILAGCAMYAVLFLCAPLIAMYFHQPVLVEVSRVTFLAFLISAFGIVPNAYLWINLRNRELATANFFGMVISGCTGIWMAYHGFAYWSLVWQQIVYISVVNIFRYYYTRWTPTLPVDFSPIRRMFRFSVKLLITNILTTINQKVLTFVFGHIFHIDTVGVYNQADKWNTTGSSFISNTINQVAQPVLTAVNDDAQREQRVFRKMTRFTAFLTFPAMFGLAMVAHEFIVITITDYWVSCVPLLQILSIGGAFLPFYILHQNMAISHGRSDLYLYCTIGQIIVQLGIILLFSHWGITTMVIAYSIFTILYLLVWQVVTTPLSHISIWQSMKDILPFLLIAACCMGGTYVATQSITNLPLLLAVRIIVSASLYFLVLRLLHAEILNECLEFAKNKIKKNK